MTVLLLTYAGRHVVPSIQRSGGPGSVRSTLNLEGLEVLGDGVGLLGVVPTGDLNDVAQRTGVGDSPLVTVPILGVRLLQLQVVGGPGRCPSLELRYLILRAEYGCEGKIKL